MIKWKASLTDGSTVIEHEGDYVVQDGEPLPWRKLCQFLTENNLALESVSLLIENREINIPIDFNRFNLGNVLLKPHSFAIQCSVELYNILGGGEMVEYVDLVAMYDNFNIHYIHSLTDQDSWIVATQGDEPIVQSPRFN